MYIISETKKLIISDLIYDVRFFACTSLIESNLLHTGGLVLKDIAVGTCVHLLSRMDDEALDGFWREVSTGEYPIVDFQGNLGYSLLSPEGLLFIRNDFTATSYEQFELVFGDIFLPDTAQELLLKDKALLLMVYRKGTQNLLLSELRMDTKFMLDLPHGEYLFFVFILDAETDSLLDSKIHAIGFPSKKYSNDPELETFYLNYPVDIWEFVDPNPIDIKRGGPYYISSIVVNVENVPDCSIMFSELLREDESPPPL